MWDACFLSDSELSLSKMTTAYLVRGRSYSHGWILSRSTAAKQIVEL